MEDVFSLQVSLQADAESALKTTEETVLRLLKSNEKSQDSVVTILTAFTDQQAKNIVQAWRDLLPTLITKYHDGYRAENLESKDIHMQKLFYPLSWLQATGFFDPKNKPNTGPNTILFQPHGHSNSALLLTAVVSSMLSVIAGIYVARHFMSSNPTVKLNMLPVDRKGYTPIENL